MKKKSFNEISGAMSKAEMKNVMGGAQICSTKCYPYSGGGQGANCIYPDPAKPNVGCFCIYPPGGNWDQICR